VFDGALRFPRLVHYRRERSEAGLPTHTHARERTHRHPTELWTFIGQVDTPRAVTVRRGFAGFPGWVSRPKPRFRPYVCALGFRGVPRARVSRVAPLRPARCRRNPTAGVSRFPTDEPTAHRDRGCVPLCRAVCPPGQLESC